ncbi:MAG TPA: NAD-dependent epimerase/dehydratase family protein [Nitrososphaeraceae archaeon]|nr:NAD-dependent epimerase/dehydratase family protein [Nitrososphaeraceae archaeon]
MNPFGVNLVKVLVTGGAGFIGSNLANSLINEVEEDKTSYRTNNSPTVEANESHFKDESDVTGYTVIALDDLSLGSPSNLSKNIRFVNGSVMNYDLVLELTKDCDYIFHQAALSSSPMFVDDPRQGMDVNIMGFMNVMEAAKRNNVKKVIYASSSSLYNGLPTPYRESDNIRPKTFYESSFYCRETIAQTYRLEYGLDSIGLRYFSIYGPNEKHKGRFANNISQFIWDMAENRKSPVIYGDGTQSRDFTFVDDVVQANILAMRKKPNDSPKSKGQIDNKDINNDVRNIDSKERSKGSINRSSTNASCEANFGSSGFVYNVGTGTQTSFNSVIKIINKQLGTDLKPTYVKNPINNYVQHTMADLSLARLELGYEPRWKNVEEGIKQLLHQLGFSRSSSVPASSSSASSSYPSIRI